VPVLINASRGSLSLIAGRSLQRMHSNLARLAERVNRLDRGRPVAARKKVSMRKNKKYLQDLCSRYRGRRQ
jgi:hypothetical protein